MTQPATTTKPRARIELPLALFSSGKSVECVDMIRLMEAVGLDEDVIANAVHLFFTGRELPSFFTGRVPPPAPKE